MKTNRLLRFLFHGDPPADFATIPNETEALLAPPKLRVRDMPAHRIREYARQRAALQRNLRYELERRGRPCTVLALRSLASEAGVRFRLSDRLDQWLAGESTPRAGAVKRLGDALGTQGEWLLEDGYIMKQQAREALKERNRVA